MLLLIRYIIVDGVNVPHYCNCCCWLLVAAVLLLTKKYRHKEALIDFKKVVELLPSDRDAQRQLKITEATIRRDAFSERNVGVFQSSNLRASSPSVAIPGDGVAPQKVSPPHIPVPWSPEPTKIPKLIDLAARCIAREAASNIDTYTNTFIDSTYLITINWQSPIFSHLVIATH